MLCGAEGFFSGGASGDDGRAGDALEAEDAPVALDLLGRAERLVEVVRELDGGTAIDLVELADKAEGIETAIALRVAVAEIVGEQCAPACAETDAGLGEPLLRIEKVGGAAEICGGGAVEEPAGEPGVKAENLVHVERVGGDEELLAGVAAPLLQPRDVFVPGDVRVLAVGALAGPVGDPVRRTTEELGGAEGVGQEDEQFAVIGLLPEFEEAILRGPALLVRAGEGSERHGQLVGVRADGFEIVLVGEIGVGGAAEAGSEGVAHGLDDILLPEKAVTAAGAEVTDAQAGDAAEAVHLLPEAGLGAGVKDVELKFAEALEGGAGAQFTDGGERVNLPESGGGP